MIASLDRIDYDESESAYYAFFSYDCQMENNLPPHAILIIVNNIAIVQYTASRWATKNEVPTTTS
jgi:hypothetical protein